MIRIKLQHILNPSISIKVPPISKYTDNNLGLRVRLIYISNNLSTINTSNIVVINVKTTSQKSPNIESQKSMFGRGDAVGPIWDLYICFHVGKEKFSVKFEKTGKRGRGPQPCFGSFLSPVQWSPSSISCQSPSRIFLLYYSTTQTPSLSLSVLLPPANF